MVWPGICGFILQDKCQVNIHSIILCCPLFISGQHEEINSVHGEEPPYFTLPTRAGIESHFPGQWMGCQGPTQWPDLTSRSCFLWGWVKDEAH